MKKLMRSLSVDLRKSFFGYGFFLCTLVVFLLCFASVIYTDGWTGKEYTAIEIIADRSQLPNIEFSGMSILHISVNPYLTLFLPVLSSIPFVTLFCAERTGGNLRFVIMRTGKAVYCLSKFLSALISGALTVCSGFILYSVVILCVFGNDGSISELMKIYAGIAVYGAISVLPAFFLSSFIKNKYMICCFPFIFMHFYYTAIAKLQDYFKAHDNWDAIFKISFLYTSEIKEIFFTQDRRAVIFYSVLTVLTFVGFYLIMNRRVDYGQ